MVVVVFFPTLSAREEHFTFVLTDLDSKYMFGFCRYPPRGETCMCFVRLVYIMYNTCTCPECMCMCMQYTVVVQYPDYWYTIFYKQTACYSKCTFEPLSVNMMKLEDASVYCSYPSHHCLQLGLRYTYMWMWLIRRICRR